MEIVNVCMKPMLNVNNKKGLCDASTNEASQNEAYELTRLKQVHIQAICEGSMQMEVI